MRILVLALFSFIGISAQGQKIEKLLSAKEHISSLKSSALLVRLQTKEKAISALEKIDLVKEADELRENQRIKNFNIINAFKEEFDFCPVYFFYSGDSDFVRNHDWDSVGFINTNLELDSTINFNSSEFYIAEFSNVDTSADKTNSQPELSFTALIIKDSNFTQLARPFPFYVRDLQSLPIRKKPKKVVKKMNEKLKEFLYF